MSVRLYAGNLSFDTTEAQLRDLFAQAGEVEEVKLITDRDTGRGKGFGFVVMNTAEQGQEAINRFNGYTLNERALTVNEARPREERSGSSGGNFGAGRRENRPSEKRSSNRYQR